MLGEALYESSVSMILQKKQEDITRYFTSDIQVTQQQILTEVLSLIIGVYSSGQKSDGFSLKSKVIEQKYRIFCKSNHLDQFTINKAINMSHLRNEALKNVISNSVKFASQLSYIQTQLMRIYADSNAIVRTFCQGSFEYLTQIKDYFSDMLAKVTLIDQSIWIDENRITLIVLDKIVSEKRIVVQMFLKCINSCGVKSEQKPQAIQLLDKMWEIQKEILPYSPFHQYAFNKVFTRTFCAYLRLVKEYFLMRPISQNNDFFIADFQKRGMFIDDKMTIPENYLHKNDEIIEQKMPLLLENHAKGIIEIGKTLRFLCQYYEDHEKQKLLKYFQVEQQFQMIESIFKQSSYQITHRVKINKKSLNQRIKERKNKKYFEQKVPVPEDNPYQIFTTKTGNFQIPTIQQVIKETQNIKNVELSLISPSLNDGLTKVSLILKNALSQMLQNLNKKCLIFFQKIDSQKLIESSLPSFIVENRIAKSIRRTLLGIKKFMLLEQGDFLQEFFNCAADILDKKKGLITHIKIYSYIKEALRNSSAKSIPEQILSAVHFDFIKYPNKDNENLKLWLTFCLRYELEGPVSYIFTSEMMEKLKSINNLIFCIKKNQILINSYWQSPHQSHLNQRKFEIGLKKNFSQISKRQKILRSSLQALLNGLLSYIVYNIDSMWSEYLISLSSCITIFQIIEESKEIVNKIYDVGINDRIFHNSVMMSLTLIEKFRRFEVILNDPSVIVHITEIEDMEFQLRGIVEVAVKVEGLRGVIDFNGYYDRTQ